MDYNGCYYDGDGTDSGWIVLTENESQFEKYDMEYNLVESNDNIYYSYDADKIDPRLEA